ncbi:MAG: DUF6519 domain-containing protein, partial [Crocosphaera sp.]|nr:DUF6519 domain-containing protein [Crocosphaera sp.]
MKGDFTRFTFDPEKGYTGVYMQQGRLQLDADWNEQVAIQQHLMQTYAKNLIGDSGSGAPGEKNDGKNFTIIGLNNKNFMIVKGHIYVNGILCQLKENISYTKQPDYPQDQALKDLENLEQGTEYAAYLDVWERHITALEDPDLFEVALNGLDTATRTKTIWQVKLIKESKWNDLSESNNALNDQYDQYLKELIKARVTRSIPENRLYRIEIHKGGVPKEAQFKWSRSNGSIAFAVKNIENNRITIDSRNLDISQFFSPGEWIEVIDESREKNNKPGTLVQLTNVIPISSEGSQVIIAPNTKIGDAINSENFPLTDEDGTSQKIKLRLWNHDPNQTDKPLYATSGKVTLEDGIEVEFSGNPENFQYQTGDYCLFPVRANQITKEEDEKLDLKRIKHYYLKLATAQFLGDSFGNWTDERPIFPPLKNTLANSDKEGLTNLKRLSVGTSETSATLVVNGTKIDSQNTQEKLEIKKDDNDDTIFIATNFSPAKKLVSGTTIFVGNQARMITEINPETCDHPNGDGAAFKVDLPFDPPLESPTEFSYQFPIARFFTDDPDNNNNKSQNQVIIRPQGQLTVDSLKFLTSNTTLSGTEQGLSVDTDVTIAKEGDETANLRVDGQVKADNFEGNRLKFLTSNTTLSGTEQGLSVDTD